MKVVDVQTHAYRIPPAVPWEDATHTVSGLEFIITYIQTDTGLRGTGLSYTVGVGATSVKALLDDYVANMVLGRNPLHIEENWTYLAAQLHRCGSGGINTLALAAVDVAMWDLMGKHLALPLYQLVGGARERIPAYASGIDFHLTLEELVARVEGYRTQGYQAAKIKIGKEDPAEDLERMQTVKAVLGPNGQLFTDVNQGWSAAEAIQRAARLDECGLGWIEEPLSSDDIAGHAQLNRFQRTPLAVGESLYNKHQFLQYLQAEAVDILQPDVARVGGITEWIKIAHMAEAWHLPISAHYMMELSVHLLCGAPNGLILENVIGGSLSELGVLTTPIEVQDGYCQPPQEPGHGIRFDERALEQHALIPERLRQTKLQDRKLQ